MVQRVLRNTKPRPRFIEPMECQRVCKLPEGGNWVYEIKQDGYRAIVLVDGNSALIYSISGQDFTSQFPHIAFALRNLKHGNLALDGEIVALDENGRASFQELQTGVPAGNPSSITHSTSCITMAETCLAFPLPSESNVWIRSASISKGHCG